MLNIFAWSFRTVFTELVKAIQWAMLFHYFHLECAGHDRFALNIPDNSDLKGPLEDLEVLVA